MHACAFGFYLFALAVLNVTYTIFLYLFSIDQKKIANLTNNIGDMTYYTASFIS